MMNHFFHQKKAIYWITGVLAVVWMCSLVTLAEGRAGGGRSSGSRGSRSFSAPSRPASPGQFSSPRSEGLSNRSAPFSQPSPSGGLWRSIGGGLIGGFLGSLLFSSLGFAGSHGGMGGGWGGPGLFDLLLLGLVGYMAYRFFFKRSTAQPAYAGQSSYSDRGEYRSPIPTPMSSAPPVNEAVGSKPDLERGIAQLRALDPEFDPVDFCDQAMDFFFRVQAAWSARDLSAIRQFLTEEMAAQLQTDIDRMKREGVVNHVENIAVRKTELTEAWQESGQDFATVYFYANCLDYDVNESTGAVVRGSKQEPSKFEEYWTLTRPVGRGIWKLSAITLAE